MNQPPNDAGTVAPANAASQQMVGIHAAPRPLPLFLSLVRNVAERDPELARRALHGLHAYMDAPRPKSRNPGPKLAEAHGALLRDHGGEGRPLILIPSLINPPHILDLDDETSLAKSLAEKYHVLLVDWGKASDRAALDVAQHIERILLPLVAELDTPPLLVGYCLGGTMAMSAAQLVPVAAVATLAAPWRFSAYEGEARSSLAAIWRDSRAASSQLGAMPMEVLQAAFWALDPLRTVSNVASVGALEPNSDEACRFIAMEDWANQGEPLPLPAAEELFDQLFANDATGHGNWSVGGKTMSDVLPCPALHCIARDDHIVPAATAPVGRKVQIDSGHVGMIVGRARHDLHGHLKKFFATLHS